jgi:hypothetical protein
VDATAEEGSGIDLAVLPECDVGILSINNSEYERQSQLLQHIERSNGDSGMGCVHI